MKWVLESEGWTVTKNDDGSIIVWRKGGKQYGIDSHGNLSSVTYPRIQMASPDDTERQSPFFAACRDNR